VTGRPKMPDDLSGGVSNVLHGVVKNFTDRVEAQIPPLVLTELAASPHLMALWMKSAVDITSWNSQLITDFHDWRVFPSLLIRARGDANRLTIQQWGWVGRQWRPLAAGNVESSWWRVTESIRIRLLTCNERAESGAMYCLESRDTGALVHVCMGCGAEGVDPARMDERVYNVEWDSTVPGALKVGPFPTEAEAKKWFDNQDFDRDSTVRIVAVMSPASMLAYQHRMCEIPG